MNNTKVLLIGAVVAAVSFSSLAVEPLLSPRAAANQIKHAGNSVASSTTAIARVDSGSALRSPRAQANEIKMVKGVSVEVNPALVCLKTMRGSPKAAAECASHTSMPGCQTMAAAR